MRGRILILNRDGRCPILPTDADEVALDESQIFRILNDREFEVLAICVADYSLPIDAIIRRASRKNPLMGIAMIGEHDISDRVALSLIDLSIANTNDQEQIAQRIEKLIRVKRLMAECDLLGKSPEIKAVAELILRVASTDLPVLIVGESGTGKELVARGIHRHSGRSKAVFLPINAAAIASGTLESELFGHERGSFTGANSMHRGFFEQANGGTLFLDEIAELPLPVQAKLLRVLETGDFMRVGGSETIKTDVRMICATNKDLLNETQSHSFRQDLYYRLSAVKVKIPPLRERPEDIPILIYKFARDLAEKRGIRDRGFSEAAIAKMMDYHWPGNVRELRNLIENAILLSSEASISTSDLEPYFEEHEMIGRTLPAIPDRAESLGLEKALAMIYSEIIDIRLQIEALRSELNNSSQIDLNEAERKRIFEAIERNANNKPRAAEELGISLRTLYRRLKKYGLE